MPIKLGRIPPAIRAGGDFMRESLADSPGATQNTVFEGAKVAAGRWAKSGIEDPATQNAPPWYVGRPFTVSRTENPDTYKNWDDAFRNRTYSGYEFGAPPPESPGGSENKGKPEAQPMSSEEAG